MLLKHILNEVRSNARLNPKVSINSVVKQEYDNAEELQIGIKNSFVSFTKIEKLGINPNSKYNTPLGIYCYPSEFVLNRTGDDNERPMSVLPFAGKSPYGNIFGVSGNIIRIDRLKENQFNGIIKQLSDLFDSKYRDVEKINETFNEAQDESYHYARHEEYNGGRLWYILMTMAYHIGRARGVKAPIMWNKLFRDIGIDCVVDMGIGIIHEAEPTQAVIFKLSAIKNNVRIDNKYSPLSVNTSIKQGESRQKLIAFFKTLEPAQQLSYIPRDRFLINYLSAPAIRQLLLQHPMFILDVKQITNEFVFASCKGSKMQLISHLYTKQLEKPSKEYTTDPKDYKYLSNTYKTYTTLLQHVKKLSEQQLLDLIEMYLDGTEVHDPIYEALVILFPHYKKMFITLLQFAYRPIINLAVNGLLPMQYDLQMQQYFKDLGATNPTNKAYRVYMSAIS